MRSKAWNTRTAVTLTDDDGAIIGTPDAPVAVASTEARPIYISYERETNLAASTGLPGIPPDATMAIVIIEGADARLRRGGTVVTTATGMPVFAGTGVKFFGADIAGARFIQQSAGAILNVEYFR